MVCRRTLAAKKWYVRDVRIVKLVPDKTRAISIPQVVLVVGELTVGQVDWQDLD
mgnify:CR=1 FL=1